jgi:ribosomal protein L16 Arg81 hydroxylase
MIVEAVPTREVALDRLFAPVRTAAFLREYWETQPLFIARDDKSYFKALFSLDAFDDLMARADLWHPNVRVFLAGEQLPHDRYSRRWAYGREVHDRLIDVDKLAELFRRGATINVLGLERTDSAVMEWSKELEVQAGFPVHTTAFLSPPSAVNVPPHFDMTDVIVAQVHGSKVWNVWQPTRAMPLVTDTAGRLYGHGSEVVSEGMRVGRYELRAGDSLYVPRGFLHEAITTTESSLHLAFGINVHRWYDVLEEAANRAIAAVTQQTVYRKALPVRRRGEPPAPAAAVRDVLRAIETDLQIHLASGLGDALHTVDSRYLGSRAPARPGQLVDSHGADDLTSEDMLVRRPRLAFGIDRVAGRLRLVFHRKQLSLGPELEAALRYSASGEPFRVSDLPDLSADQQLAFAHSLVREGFLSIIPGPASTQSPN